MEQKQGDQEEELHKLLECYMYLKVYQVWDHSLEDISVKQTVGLVKTEVCNLCEGEEGLELLVEVLVREDLLVPGQFVRR